MMSGTENATKFIYLNLSLSLPLSVAVHVASIDDKNVVSVQP